MDTALFRSMTLLLAAVLSSGCATEPPIAAAEKRPMLFHNTRLQYALLTNDQHALKQDFGMWPEPALVEQVLSGLVLPFTAATETMFWPVSASIKAYLAHNLDSSWP